MVEVAPRALHQPPPTVLYGSVQLSLQVFEDQTREVPRLLLELAVAAQIGDRHEQRGVAARHREVAPRFPRREPHRAIPESRDLFGVFLRGEEIVLRRSLRDAVVDRGPMEDVARRGLDRARARRRLARTVARRLAQRRGGLRLGEIAAPGARRGV